MALPMHSRRADISSFYTCQHPEQFAIDWRLFYERSQARTEALRTHVRHELDVTYGSSPKHVIDLYYPAGGGPWPTFLFLHGGGFREGDPALYGYLAEPFVERGIAFASVGYRLTPECHLPETLRDVQLMLGWMFHHTAERGLDRDRLYLGGHSAGAILTGLLLTDGAWTRVAGLPNEVVKGLAPISGVFAYHDRPDFLRPDASVESVNTVGHVAYAPAHAVVSFGAEERAEFTQTGPKLVDELRQMGASVELVPLPGCDHAQAVDSLSDEESPLFQAVHHMIAGERQ